jgi:hypothetical protein
MHCDIGMDGIFGDAPFLLLFASGYWRDACAHDCRQTPWSYAGGGLSLNFCGP